MPLPAHGRHNLLSRGSVLALEHRDHLRGLALLARCRGFLRLRCLLGILHLLNRLFTRQTVQNRQQALCRPSGGQFRQLLLAGEDVKRGLRGGGSKFGQKKEAAIAALLSEKNHAEAARVQQNTPAAGAILLKLMVDAATPASGKIRTALGIFALSREALDLDIETRVSALERAKEEQKNKG
jgi:hypothetical protein